MANMEGRPILVSRTIPLTVEQAEFLRVNAPVFQCSESELIRKLLTVAMGLKDQLPVPEGRPSRGIRALMARVESLEGKMKVIEGAVKN